MTGVVPVSAGLLCSCGRAATSATQTELFGVVGWCGSSNVAPLSPCQDVDCLGHRTGPHSSAWCGSAPAERVWTETDDDGQDWLVIDTRGLSPQLREQVREQVERALLKATS